MFVVFVICIWYEGVNFGVIIYYLYVVKSYCIVELLFLSVGFFEFK